MQYLYLHNMLLIDLYKYTNIYKGSRKGCPLIIEIILKAVGGTNRLRPVMNALNGRMRHY